MISELILQYCNIHNITQKEFARKIGVNGYLLSIWLKNNELPHKGKNKDCAQKIANLVGCRADELDTYRMPNSRISNYALDNGKMPDCEHCEWAIDCGTINRNRKIFCGFGGNKCANAK